MTDESWPYVIEPAITKPRVGTSHTFTPGQDANFAQCPISHPYLGRSTDDHLFEQGYGVGPLDPSLKQKKEKAG